MKTILAATLLVCSVSVARCDLDYFTVTATGSQETPPNLSGAAGGGIATYDTVANTVSVSMFFAGLSSPATASHIHDGASGVPGPVQVSFVPFTPASTFGSIVGGPLAFPALKVPALLAGDTYFNIHDAVFPGGEIRGQITPAAETVSGTGAPVGAGGIEYFTIAMSGAQETPPNLSGAVGGGIAAFNPVANTISLSMFFAGLSAPATAAHLHVGAPGVPGPVDVSFTPFTPAATSGSIVGGPLAFPVSDVSALLAGDIYFNIHDSVFPGGEIRGQLVPVGRAAAPDAGATSAMLGIALLTLSRLNRALRR